MTNVPWYPSRPEVAGFPVDPELVVSGLLGVVTVSLAALSLHARYSAGSVGAFTGGLYTLVAGVALALLVVDRNAAHELTRRGLTRSARDRFVDTKS